MLRYLKALSLLLASPASNCTASARAYSCPVCNCQVCQRHCAADDLLISSNSSLSGENEYVKLLSGMASPNPLALTYASLSDQSS